MRAREQQRNESGQGAIDTAAAASQPWAMCNLYKMRRSVAEVAHLFGISADRAANFGEDVYPGYPGLVIVEGIARTMTWGFPLRLKSMRPTSKPKPVNNTRDDKLHTPFWRASFENRRCLIPVTAWAEAEGENRRMTRTWYSLPGVEVFAVAGIWRPSDEWGDVYSMVMVDGCSQMSEVHDRMPVILPAAAWQRWLEATPAEALALVRTCDDALVVERTDEPWFKRRS